MARAVFAVACVASALAWGDIPEPRISPNRLQVWNATAGVPYCANGLIGALGTALGLDDPSALEMLLGGLLGEEAISEANAALEKNYRAAALSLRSADSRSVHFADASISSTRSDGRAAAVALSKAVTAALTVPFLAAIKTNPDAVIKTFKESLSETELDRIKQAVEARGGTAESGFEEIHLRAEGTEGVDEGTDEGAGGGIADDLVELLGTLEKPLLTLQTKGFTRLLNAVLGHQTGSVHIGGFFNDFITFSKGWTSPMVNFVDEFFRTSESGWEHDVEPKRSMCAVVDLVGAFLTCSATDDVVCDPEYDGRTWMPPNDYCDVAEYDMANENVVFNFSYDREFTPELMEEEGFQLFLLYRAVRASAAYSASMFSCGKVTPNERLLPGWDVTNVISYVMEGVHRPHRNDTAFALIARPIEPVDGNQCQFLLTFRGTAYQSEWAVDFNTVLIPFLKEGVKVHRGIGQLVNSIWPSIENELVMLMERDGCVDEPEFILVGHSLGGGAALMVALLLAETFEGAKITAATFGGPSLLSPEAAELLNEKVNLRNVVFDFDPVTAMACAGANCPTGMARCAFAQTGGAFGLDVYAKNPSMLQLDLMEEVGGENFYNLSDALGSVGFLFNLAFPSPLLDVGIQFDIQFPAPVQFGVAHTEAYGCALSKYCTSDPAVRWECQNAASLLPPASGEMVLMSLPLDSIFP